MSLIGTLAGTLGPSIAKVMLKSWLDDEVGAALSNDIVDLIKAKLITTQPETIERLNMIGSNVATQIFLIFENEKMLLDSGERAALLYELARTLAGAHFDGETLITICRFDPLRLQHYLKGINPSATQVLSEAGLAAYDRILARTSSSILEVMIEMASYERHALTTTLQEHDQILNLLSRLMAQQNEEDYSFEYAYCQALQQRLDRMEVFGVPRMDTITRRQSLSVAFVSLHAQQHILSEHTNLTDNDFLTRILKLEATGNNDRLRQPPHESIDVVNQLLSLTRYMIIRGEAGSGKSTLLQWLAVRSAAHDFPSQLSHWNKTVPFFIRLRECVGQGFPKPEAFVQIMTPMLSGKMPHGWVHRQLDAGRALVLIDGVDELPQDQRMPMLEHLQQLQSTYPNTRYIITSRPYALKQDQWPTWQEWVEKHDFAQVTLQSMTLKQVDTFIYQWHAALAATLQDEHEQHTLQQHPAHLKRLLRQRPALRRLATNPLLCAMICALHRERQDNLPTERLELYRECVEMLLSHRETGRKIRLEQDYPNLSLKQKYALIQSFAYWLLRNGYSDASIDDADAHFQDKLPALDLDVITTGERVRSMFVERCAILREPIQYKIDFAHRTFQEFLAAQEIVKIDDLGFLVRQAADDQWRETIILAAGISHPRECERLLKRLVQRGIDLKRRGNDVKILAVACLETAVELSPDIKRYVLNAARELFPPKTEEQVKLVSVAGDPAIPLLEFNSLHSDNINSYCIQALSRIGTRRALTALANYAKNSQTAGYWLRSAWKSFDVQEYLHDVLIHASIFDISDDDIEMSMSELVDSIILFPNLKEIFLRNNERFEDYRPLMKLPNHIDVSVINIDSTDILEKFRGLTCINRVLLNYSPSDKDIEILSSIPNIRKLGINLLSYLNIRNLSNIKLLSNIKSLSELSLYNIPKGFDFSDMQSLYNIKHLRLYNFLKGLNWEYLSKIPNLTSIILDEPPLDVLTILSSTNLSHLSILDMRDPDILHILGEFGNLTNLSLYRSNAPIDLRNFTKTNLKYLSISKMNSGSVFSNVIPVTSITNFRLLLLGEDKSVDLPDIINIFPNINELEINANLSKDDLIAISKISNLTTIKITTGIYKAESFDQLQEVIYLLE